MDLTTLALRDFTVDLNPRISSSQADCGGKPSTRATLRRCRTREQGLALLTVGHAIEYLVQSRLIQQQTTTGAEREALAILLQANLSVYNEGAEVVPLKARLRRWLHGSPINPKIAAAQ